MSPQTVTDPILTVTVVTPEGELWSGTAVAVTVPGSSGSMGILPRRQPLATELAAGQVQIRTLAGGPVSCTVTGGIVVVDQDDVTVIADKVEPAGPR